MGRDSPRVYYISIQGLEPRAHCAADHEPKKPKVFDPIISSRGEGGSDSISVSVSQRVCIYIIPTIFISHNFFKLTPEGSDTFFPFCNRRVTCHESALERLSRDGNM